MTDTTQLSALSFLNNAANHMAERAVQYDSPNGERSIAATVTAFNAATGLNLTEAQGWFFMLMLKAVRSQQGEFKADSFEDLVAYAALAGEAASVGNA